MGQLRGRAYGIALVAAASILWSTAGLFVRLLDADGPLDLWTMLTWRAGFAAISLFIVIALQHRRQTLRAVRAIGWPGLAAVPVAATSMVSYVAALKLTTVANVMVIYATVPFLAALLAYFWIGERVERRVLAASAVALIGILVMAGAATRPQDIAGNALAFLMTLTFAAVLVMARRYPSLGMALINAFASVLGAHRLPARPARVVRRHQHGARLHALPDRRPPHPVERGRAHRHARRRPRPVLGLAPLRRATRRGGAHRRRPRLRRGALVSLPGRSTCTTFPLSLPALRQAAGVRGRAGISPLGLRME
jgi:hypothetical protein